MRKVLIIGATGFIGRHLQVYFAAQGWQVECSAQRAEDFQSGNFSFECEGKEAVINAAGLAHSQLPDAEHGRYQQVNAEFAQQLAVGAIRAAVPRFIHLSSVKAAAYEPLQALNCERNEGWPTDSYGRSKRQGEQLLQALDWRSTKLTILRPALVFGAGVKANLRTLIRATHKGWLPLIVGGGERSLLGLDDLCRAVQLVLEQQTALPDSLYIVSDSETYTVARIQMAVRRAQGKAIETQYKVSADTLHKLASLPTPMRARLGKLLHAEVYSSDLLFRATGWKAKQSIENSMPDLLKSIGLKSAASGASASS